MPSRRILAGLAAAAATLAFTHPVVPGSEQLVSAVEVADADLVADAGDSAYVSQGEHAVFLGTAFGGSGNYTFAWSGEGFAFEDTSNPTGAVDTTDLAPGTYVAELAVTDGTATATDTVQFEVAGPGDSVTLLPTETQAPDEPGAANVPAGPEYAFDVPPGMASVEAVLTWTDPSNDYDLVLVSPGGTTTIDGEFIPDSEEVVTIANPEPGEWTARVERFATHGDLEITTTVTGVQGLGDQGDPRPVVDGGGPYEYLVDDAKALNGSVTGGTSPVEVGWDTDLDGVVDAEGATTTLDLPVGRHLVTLHATDASGFERREMVSVAVGRDAAHLDELAVPFTVIGIADTGINPYHAEYSAATYPDPEVLELTRNFTRHPSEYIEGYPADAPALPATTGDGYFPERDTYLWDGNHYVDAGQLYWVPGTKVIGAIDAGGSTGATSGADTHPILDDNGHGSGSTSVSAGNRYGYCPTCLLVIVEALNEAVVADYPWVDVSSNSFGAIGGVPLGLVFGADEPTKQAAERGQLTLFSAGNGTGNAFATTPIQTYGSSPNGADWVLSIGATREDNQGAIISDGYPVHISALGDGDLPSACRTGDTGQCAFGGTSAASPYTAGAFGKILTEVRDAIGDTRAGQRAVELPDGTTQRQAVAVGTHIAESPFLEDGILTREELRTVGLKTAMPRGQGTGPDTSHPFPWTWSGPNSVYFEGYGSSGPAHAERAIEVLLGERQLPARPMEDEFFAQDCEHRDSLYGGYDRDGDGEQDGCEASGVNQYVGEGEATNDDPSVGRFDAGRDAVADGGVLTDPIAYELHRVERHEPTRDPAPVTEDPTTAGDPGDALETHACGEGDNEQFMARAGEPAEDVEVCFDNRITSVPAAFRPKGIFTATDHLGGGLPAGSTVQATIYMQSSEPTTANLELVLKATDREVGRSEAVAQPVHPAGWTAFDLQLTTDRLVAPGEQLTVNLVHAGARSWAYGYNDDHASTVTITPAGAPETGNEFGVTIDPIDTATDRTADGLAVSGAVAFPALGEDPQLAGFHAQSLDVQVAADADFTDPVYATLDPAAGTWSAVVPGEPAEVHVRALRDRFPSGTAAVEVPAADEGDTGDGDDGDEESECGNERGRGQGQDRCGGQARPDQPGQSERSAVPEESAPSEGAATLDADVARTASDGTRQGLALVALVLLALAVNGARGGLTRR